MFQCEVAYLDESQVSDHLRTALSAHLASRQLQLEVGQLCPGELEAEPQQGGGQSSLSLRGEGGGAADPGVGALLLGDGGEVAQQQQVLVVGHLLVGRVHPCSVPNSSSGLIFVIIRAESGRIFSKNPGKIRAKIRAKLKFCDSVVFL